MKKFNLIIALTALVYCAKSQPSSAIMAQMESFNSFKTVLYLAAHPDDENTRVISWLVNGEHARTGYLSLTRGDGGQNLIGKEFGDELGILRTRELLAARSIDGGEQFFTRAVDFGYSRNATETLEKWDEEAVLSDIVWVIRNLRPQLIITRFPPDGRGGHGHHTASAMLAIEAFAAAADPNKFKEQLKYVEPYQVQSVYWNGSQWWDKNLQSDMEKDSTIWRADIGGYDALTGESYNELGSLARSQHKCQGFGVDIQRGESFEYFRPLIGDALPRGLANLKTPTWSSLGVPQVEDMFNTLWADFNPEKPEESLPELATIYNQLYKIKDKHWRDYKQEQCKNLIVGCSGLYVEALADKYLYQPGELVNISVNFLSRLTDQLAIDGVMCNGAGLTFKMAASLPKNTFANFELEVPSPLVYSNPYWLVMPHKNMYVVDNVDMIGKPENKPILEINTTLLVDGKGIALTIPVRYKWQDRVEGEMQREPVVTPPLAVNFAKPMFVSLNSEEIVVRAKVTWFTDTGSYAIKFLAKGWEIENSLYVLRAKGIGKEEWVEVVLEPYEDVLTDKISVQLNSADAGRSFHEIAYSHIPTQVNMPLAEAKLVQLDVFTRGKKVAYINGAGDNVAEGIAQMGYIVEELNEANIATADLTQYQAIVVGIRAYNTQAWLQNYSKKIFAYIEDGGNYIVQYNTASRFLQDAPLIPAPFTFKLGRGRVTDEEAKPTFLLPKNPIFNKPNKITPEDFNGWVQERGLYFAQEWDEHFIAPIAWNDKDQEPEEGAIIIGQYGKGAFIYTGISFFRELPAGVPGAYRLLANLISYKNKKKKK